MLVSSNAIFDGLGVFFAMEKGLPGIDVLGFMKIAVGQEGHAFESDRRENIIAIGDFPGIDDWCKNLLIFPQK